MYFLLLAVFATTNNAYSTENRKTGWREKKNKKKT